METLQAILDGKSPSTSFSIEQVDTLLHYLFEKEITSEEREQVIKSLCKTSEKGRYKKANKDLVTSDFASEYASLRSLGLSSKDAAACLRITPQRLNGILRGNGLTPEQHEMMLLAERSADADFKRMHLRIIKEAAECGKWQASVALLEKVYPNEYGKRMDVTNNTVVRMSSSECEEMAVNAQRDLARIRAQRKESENDAELE